MKKVWRKLLVLLNALILLLGMIPAWPSGASADSGSPPAVPVALNKAYIPNMPNGAENGTLDVVNLSDFTVEAKKITVGKRPTGVAYNPNGSQVFVTNTGETTVSVIDPSTDTVVGTIELGTYAYPTLVNFDSTGSKAYVACANGSIAVIDASNMTVVKTFTLSGFDYFPQAFFAAGNKLYVAAKAFDGSGKLFAVDTPTDTVGQSIGIGQFPTAIAGNAQGTKVYVSDRSGMSIIDTVAWKVEDKRSDLGADQIEVSPDGVMVYLFTAVGYVAYDTLHKYKIDVRPFSNLFINSGGLSADEKYAYELDVNKSQLAVVDTDKGVLIKTIQLSDNGTLYGSDSKRFMIPVSVAVKMLPSYKVTFDSQGGSSVAPLSDIAAGTRINRLEPASPTKNGLKFGGWYKDAAAQTRWNFPQERVTADVTLYAKWEDKKNALLHKAYIPSMTEGAVDVVDLSDLYVEKGKIELGAYKDGNLFPVSAVINPNLSQLFVGNSQGQSVSVIDTTTDTVIKKIAVSGAVRGIAFNSDGSKAYVAAGSAVTVIDTNALSVAKTIALPNNFNGNSVINVGSRILVTLNGLGSGYVAVIDTAKDQIEQMFTGSSAPSVMALNPQGTKIYITNLTAQSVSVVNAATFKEEAQIKLSGSISEGIETSPDGYYLYVGEDVNNQGFVDVIDTRTNEVVKQLPTTGTTPSAISVSTDGTTLYVTNLRTNNMSVIDVETGNVQTYSLSRYPNALGGFTIPTALAVKLLPKYTVTFDSKGGSAVPALTGVLQGAKIAEPPSPTLTGYQFAGWYKDQALTGKWNFQSDKIAQDTTLYAKWSRPVPASTVDEPEPGSQKGSTRFVTAVTSRYDFAVKISDKPIDQPVEGDRLGPNEPDTIRDYHLSDDIASVGSRAQKYAALYIVDKSKEDEILYFSQFLLYDSNIKDDDTALKPIAFSPADKATNVAVDAPLVITFNDPVKAAAGKYITVKGPKVREYGSSSASDETVLTRIAANDSSKIAINGATVTVNLGQNLGSAWHYAVSIDRGAFEDLAGNGYGGLDGYVQIDRNADGSDTYSDASSPWSFSTVYVSAPPAVTSFTPANGSVNVPRDKELTIVFDQKVTAVAGKRIWIKKSSDSSTLAEINLGNLSQFSMNNSTFRTHLNLSDDTGYMNYNTDYYVEIEAGAFVNDANQAYGGLSGKTAWTFTTGEQPPAPKAVSYVPASGAAGVDRTQDLVLTFDQNVNNGKGNVRIWKKSDSTVACQFMTGSYEAFASGKELRIKVMDSMGESCLAPNTEYAVQIDSGAFLSNQRQPYAGIADLTTWTFTTAAASPMTPAPGFTPVPVPEPGTKPGTTELPNVPVTIGHHLVVKVSTSVIATPNTGDAAPSGNGIMDPYTAGSDIPGADPVVNRYIGLYEVDGSGKIVKFTLIVLNTDDVKPGTPPSTPVPGFKPSPVPEPGTNPGTTEIPNVTVAAGHHLVVKVSSGIIATPTAGEAAPSGNGIIDPYTAGSDIPGVDPLMNRYIGLYEVDGNGKIVKFTLIVLNTDDVKPGTPPSTPVPGFKPSPVPEPGTNPGTTEIPNVTVAAGHHLVVKVSSGIIATATVGEAAPSGNRIIDPYTAGSDIPGVDPVVNRYIGLYEVNGDGKVVSFTLIVLNSGDVNPGVPTSAPVPGFKPSPVPEPGTNPGTTEIPNVTVAAGHHLIVKVSSAIIATPTAGETAPSGNGIIDPYTAGSDIPGVDPVVNRYIGLYEVDGNGKIVKFTLIVLNAGDVNPGVPTSAPVPGFKPSPVPEPGTSPGTTELPNVSTANGNHLVVKVSSGIIATPTAGEAAPSGNGIIDPYTAGSDIPGVDPLMNRYIGLYEVDGDGKVVSFALIILNPDDVTVDDPLPGDPAPGFKPVPVPEPGTTPGTTVFSGVSAVDDHHLVVKVSSSVIATPNVGDTAPSGNGIINPYTAGSDIPGVDAVMNRYIGLYEVDADGKIVSFRLILLGEADVKPQPTSTPAPGFSPTPIPEPGHNPGTTTIPGVTAGNGHHLVVKVSSSVIATPNVGDTAPSGNGIINPYTAGSDIPGVDAVTNRYIGVYEVDADGKIVKFRLVLLNGSEIADPGPNQLEEDASHLNIVYQEGDSVDQVTRSVFLPTVGQSGTTDITWASSDPDVVDIFGRVKRSNLAVDKEVTLTAVIRDRATGETKTIRFTVHILRLSDEDAVRDAARDLTPQKAFTFVEGDAWESVTKPFLMLNQGLYGTAISWTSSDLRTIEISANNAETQGNINRPSGRDRQVLLTATITKANVKVSKTFLIIVKSSSVTKDNNSTRQATTRTAEASVHTDGTQRQDTFAILRTTLSDRTHIDTVIINAAQIEVLTNPMDPQATDVSKRTVTVRIKQPATDPADEIAVEIPALAVVSMADRNAWFELYTDEGSVILSSQALKDSADKGLDLYFRIVPVKATDEQSEVRRTVSTDPLVLNQAAGRNVSLQGIPRKMETNFSGFATKVVLPFTGMSMPSTNQQAFLSGLRVFVEHTDGSNELLQGNVVYESGVPVGIEIEINRFSRFQVVSFDTRNDPNPEQGQQGQTSGNGDPSSTSGIHKPYILGFEDGSFKPNQKTTRAEIAMMLSRLSTLTKDHPALAYADVKNTYWAASAIDTVTEMGLMNGYSNGDFLPDKSITRAEMAVIVTRWLGSASNKDTTSSPGFSDTKGHWAEAAIQQAQASGLLRGYTDGTFRPDQVLTRAEAVVILNRMLGRGPLVGMKPIWKDVPVSYWAFGDIQEASAEHAFEKTASGEEKYITRD